MISGLNTATGLAAGDALPIASQAGGEDQKATLAMLAAYLQGALTFPSVTMVRQFASPNASGFSVAVAQANLWLTIQPAAPYASGTIVLPAVKADQQRVQVNCTQAVTALTVSGNGATVSGAPTALVQNGYFTMQWDATNQVWFRVA